MSMTDKEIIEVVQAHSEGEQIQFRDFNIPTWTDCIDNEPVWNFGATEYRVKPESKIHPYKDRDECWNDMQNHQPFGWIKHKHHGNYFCLVAMESCTHFEDLFKKYIYVDGSPFGIVEEE